MCNFVNTNEVVKLLKKHVESVNIFYICTIYYTYIGAINSFEGSYVPIYWQRFFYKRKKHFFKFVA